MMILIRASGVIILRKVSSLLWNFTLKAIVELQIVMSHDLGELLESNTSSLVDLF